MIGVFPDVGVFTLEPPWLNNEKNISCIPDGDYLLRLTGDVKFPIEIMNVPNRSGIFMHVGNWVRQTRGCVLVGNQISISVAAENRRPRLTLANSAYSLRFLLYHLEKINLPITLSITGISRL